MLLVKVKNPQFLKRPWLFTTCTLIGGAGGIYFAGPRAQNLEVISAVGVVFVIINLWFFMSLRQTLRDQKRLDSQTLN
jgi:hypothetical protein